MSKLFKKLEGKAKPNKVTLLQVRMDNEIVSRIRKSLRKHNLTWRSLMETILNEYLEQEKKEEKGK